MTNVNLEPLKKADPGRSAGGWPPNLNPLRWPQNYPWAALKPFCAPAQDTTLVLWPNIALSKPAPSLMANLPPPQMSTTKGRRLLVLDSVSCKGDRVLRSMVTRSLPMKHSTPEEVLKRVQAEGVDVSMLRERLSWTPTQRVLRHQSALELVLELRKAGEKKRAQPSTPLADSGG